MKLRFLTLLLTLSSSLAFAASEKKPEAEVESSAIERKMSVNTDVIGLLRGLPNLGVSFKIAPAATLGVSGAYVSDTVSGASVSAGVLGVGYTHWFSGEAFKSGWVLGGSINFVKADANILGFESSGTGVGMGVGGGYAWVFTSGFMLDIQAALAVLTSGTVGVGIGAGIGFAF